jgi:hypothetical protein
MKNKLIKQLLFLTILIGFVACKESVDFYTIEVTDSNGKQLSTTISAEGIAALMLNNEQYAIQVKPENSTPVLVLTKVNSVITDTIKRKYKFSPVALGNKPFKQDETVSFKDSDGGKDVNIKVTQIVAARIKRDPNGFIPACLDDLGRPDPNMCCSVQDHGNGSETLMCCGPCGGRDSYPSNCAACTVQYPPGEPQGRPTLPLSIFIKNNKEIFLSAE